MTDLSTLVLSTLTDFITVILALITTFVNVVITGFETIVTIGLIIVLIAMIKGVLNIIQWFFGWALAGWYK